MLSTVCLAQGTIITSVHYVCWLGHHRVTVSSFLLGLPSFPALQPLVEERDWESGEWMQPGHAPCHQGLWQLFPRSTCLPCSPPFPHRLPELAACSLGSSARQLDDLVTRASALVTQTIL